MRSFAINGLELLNQEPTYVVTTIDGMDDPDRRVNSYVRAGEDGGNVGSNLYGLRGLSITGLVSGSGSRTVYQAARSALVAVCRLQSDQYGIPILARFDLTGDDGTPYFFMGAITSFKAPLGNPTGATFIIQVSVPDPAIYGTLRITTGQFTRPTLGGVVYPVVYPAIYGSTTGGTAQITNTGETDTWPTLTLRGLLTNPFIYLIEQGVGFKLNYVLGVNDVVVIDMRAKTITLNGTANLLAMKDDTTDWFALSPGPSTVQLTTGSSSDTGTLEVSAYPAFLAVA